MSEEEKSFRDNVRVFLSPAMQIVKSRPHLYDRLQKIVYETVWQIENNKYIAASLRGVPNPDGTRQAREVTIRERPDGPAIFNVFVSWSWKPKEWRACVELPSENYFQREPL